MGTGVGHIENRGLGSLRKLWVTSTSSLLLTYALLIALLGTPSHGQDIGAFILKCNDGTLESKTSLELLKKNLPLVAFINKACREAIANIDSEFASQLALLVGDSDYLLSEESSSEFEELVKFSYSFGSRSAFVQSKKTLEFYIDRFNRLGASSQVDANILGFLGSTSSSAREEVVNVLPVETVMLFTPITDEGLLEFLDYCTKIGCRPVESESEFCAFSDPVSMKFQAVSSPPEFWERIRNCGAIDYSVTAKLRVIGILDGRCSFALQQNAVQYADNLPTLTCRDQLKESENISTWDDHDVYFLLAPQDDDESKRLFRLPEYNETLSKFLDTWPTMMTFLREIK